MTRSRWPTVGDVAFVLLVMLVFLIMLGLIGCKSSRPKVPCPECEQTVVTELVPAPCVIEIAPLPAPKIPGMPSSPGHDADEAELKAWALMVGEAIEQREAVWRAREKAWQKKIEAHNSSQPKCSDGIVP